MLPVLLLVSGFCGISYEVLYGRILGNLFGDQFAVNAAILLTFLLGIGLGTKFAHRLWRQLWLIEAGIGACGILFALATPVLDAASGGLGRGLAGVVAMAIVVVCVPAFLIGCSVPLFAGYLARLRGGRPFARVYAIYNIGAAVTALGIEFVLVRALGLRSAVCAVAALNGIVACGLRFGFGGLRDQPPEPAPATEFPRGDLAALALASVASAVFQLTMMKIAECVFGPFRETFAIVLALVLLGIAIGSVVVDRARLPFGVVLGIAAAGLVWLLAAFYRMAYFYAHFYPAADGHASSLGLRLAVAASMMLVPAMAFGATVPALLRQQAQVARDSGQLLFVSSIANVVGFLAVILFVHRSLDYGTGLVVTAVLVALALLVHVRGWWRAASLAIVAAALLAWRAGWDERLLYFGHTAFHTDGDLADAERTWNYAETYKTYQDTFSITWIDGRPHFFINGFISIGLDSPAEKLVGAFSSLFAPRHDRALVLGVGSGATAGTVARLFDHMDGVEINEVVLANLDLMAKWNFGLANRTNIELFHDDAIHHVKTSAETYSLVVNTVTTPLYFSSSKLYTDDFLRVVHERLTPDGVYMTWFDSRVGDTGADIILSTLSRNFRHCGLGAIKSTYFLLLCSDAPLHVADRELVTRDPVLAAYFRTSGIAPEAIPYGLLTANAFDLVGTRMPSNTLDRPTLEFEIASLSGRGIPGLKQRLLDHLEPMVGPGWDPTAAAAYLEKLIGGAIAKRYREAIAPIATAIRRTPL